ncbi:hypothetical protein TVAGG3_0231610 [Trichomonas vaginalis G3]|uniref:hypothetical protein n=1 Tax=Trichomonas vaginalis (strain ATCC PRA-98 / G3) TaxID=412133 RepID=UPI0021E590F0|nr:hypothetical protein TVAGG3_0231610 [Trichomonas vaginalis G3]KAI5552675.1 hypothetical protein TVAGG3_0231610 [Trichomonas vaginalis G3]
MSDVPPTEPVPQPEETACFQHHNRFHLHKAPHSNLSSKQGPPNYYQFPPQGYYPPQGFPNYPPQGFPN